jgi:Zn-dependent protease/CBS domain-containing protein
MFLGGIKLFTIRGIKIKLDYSWFIIFVLVTVSLKEQQFGNLPWHQSWGLGLVTSLFFFISVLLHELGHSVVAQMKGIKVPQITLFVFGGAAQIAEEPKSASDEFLMAMAGPAVSVLLFIFFGALAVFSFSFLHEGSFTVSLLMEEGKIHPLVAVLSWLSLINLMLAIFNMIPGFPLDGGRVLRSAIWSATGNAEKSTRVAAGIGRMFAFFFIFLGLYLLAQGLYINGIWMAFIGWFLLQASTKSLQAQKVKEALTGYYASQAMIKDFPLISPETTIHELVFNYILPLRKHCFPVMANETVTGIVTINSLKKAPRQQWNIIKVNYVMVPAAAFKTVSPSTPLMEVMKIMTSNRSNLVAVVDDKSFLGMVTMETIMDFIKIKSELGLDNLSNKI